MKIGEEQKRRWAFWLILLLGVGVRVWRFGAMPWGLNQDEAFAGYEAWSLLKSGTDSAGYAWPVYLTAWGSGMNALESYLMLPFLALFGRQVWVIRLPQLLVGCLSIPALYGCVRRESDEETALWAMLLLAICPWHVMLSRWGLESNLAPGFLLFGTYFFLRGLENGRWLLLSGLLYGLALYAYAAIWPVLPLVLLLQLVYCLRRRKLKVDARLWAFLGILGLLALPLLLFLMVNFGWIGENRTAFFSIPRLLEMRSGEVSLNNLPEKLGNLLRLLAVQSDGLPWNSIGSIENGGLYGLLYILTPPFILLGLLRCIIGLLRDRGGFQGAALLLFWLLGGLLLGALLQVNVNRVNLLFLPLLLLAAVGIRWFVGLFHGHLAPVLLAAYLLLFGGFCARYFDTDGYQREIGFSFGYGLDAALAETSGDASVVLDEHVYYSQVLFDTGLPVERFRETVVYERYPAAYLRAVSFDKYRLDYAGQEPEADCYILSPWTDGSALEAAGYHATSYGIYTLWRK